MTENNPHWIDIKDGLPEHGGDCYITCMYKDEVRCVYYASYSTVDRSFCIDNWDYNMPLYINPLEPKENDPISVVAWWPIIVPQEPYKEDEDA